MTYEVHGRLSMQFKIKERRKNKDGDAFLTDQTEITNKFNSFFTNISFNLSNQIKIPKNKSFRSYLTYNYN